MDFLVNTQSQHASLEQLRSVLITYSQQHATGRLEIQTRSQYYHLYFELGRLAWTSGGTHPERRWRRQFVRACRNSDLTSSYPAQDALRTRDRFEAWDYHLLLALHRRQQVEVDGVRQVMAGVTAEVLFDLFYIGTGLLLLPPEKVPKNAFALTWQPNLRASQELLAPSSWIAPFEAALAATEAAWQAWQLAGLGRYSPDLCPGICQLEQLQAQVAPETYKNLTTLLDGNRSLRDIATIMRTAPLKIASSLLPYVQCGVVAFDELRDLQPRVPGMTTTANSGDLADKGRRKRDRGRAALVACIDDSLQNCRIAEQLLARAGCRSFCIQAPLQALPSLVAKKPDLILLDLVMPNISGYELCAQIRRISALKETPIVIVTGNDGIIDRVRAKLVGATDYITKPLSSQKLQEALGYIAKPQQE